VTGRVNDADFELPDTKRFIIAKQPVELAAIARDVVEVEDTTEDPLNLTNVTEMAALRAGVSPRLQNGVQEQLADIVRGERTVVLQFCHQPAQRLA